MGIDWRPGVGLPRRAGRMRARMQRAPAFFPPTTTAAVASHLPLPPSILVFPPPPKWRAHSPCFSLSLSTCPSRASPSRHTHSLAAGVRARAAADPAFAYKLAVECGLDAAIIVCVNAGARGWDWRRLGGDAEFVLSQVAVSLLNDFALVYLLAPTVPVGAATAAAAAAAAVTGLGFSAALRSRLAALPSHVLARGPYPLSARAACFAARAAQYGAVGFSMGVLGSSLVAGLTAVREAADPAWVPPPTRQSVLGTGVGWCWFMSTSSNVRYNLVNGAEDALYGAAAAGSVPGLVPRVGSVALRLANNVAGARGWLATARALKLEQPRLSRAEREAAAAAQAKAAAVTAGWGWRKRAAAAAAA